ncbi:clock circadian regulator b [Salvelinus namaycush]|uniref:Circadian locomoter output cycles protein kaput n=1 Tax=Salvelinus namaycush TaxID=8040 RepID=A0A8U0U3X5_SALNM|nr:clock circadian regulator b [Salvelinus namaycush]
MTSSIGDDSSIFDGSMEEDEKDKAKRVSRNKSEKKRRDQFNVLIKELGTMLPGITRKMDKSTILQKSIDFLCKHNETSAQSESSEIRQDWKPPFLSNEEFTQLMLEALDGFFIAIMTDGNIIYVSESVTSLLEHLPSDLQDQNLLDFLPLNEHSAVYKALSKHPSDPESLGPEYLKTNNQLEFSCHVLRGTIDPKEPAVYEHVKFIGNFKSMNDVPNTTRNGLAGVLQRSLQPAFDDLVCFVATVRLAKPQFIKEMCTVAEPNEEFTSRHSLEWKFLFLDHRAPPIIGYLPFEVLGTSGYDYYHVDDLETLAKCHEHCTGVTTHTHTTPTSQTTHTSVSLTIIGSLVSIATASKLHMDIATPPHQSHAASTIEMTSQRRSSISSQSMSSQTTGHSVAPVHPVIQQHQQQQQHQPDVQPVLEFSAQVNVMQHLKDQLEQRTRLIQANIQRQQDELRAIQDQLHRVQPPAIQMFVQQPAGALNVQLPQVGVVPQGAVLTNQVQQTVLNPAHTGSQLTIGQQQTPPPQQNLQLQQNNSLAQVFSQSLVQQQQRQQQQQQQQQQQPVYNMIMSQPGQPNLLQISTSLPQNNTQQAVATFTQDNTQIQFPAGQQLVTKLVTAPMACGTVMVPTSMFMGQPVIAYNPFGGQQGGQTLTLQAAQPQQNQPDSQTQTAVVAQSNQQGAQQFVQGTRLLHGNQQLILQAAFPMQQQQQAFAQVTQQQSHNQRHQLQLKPQPQKQPKGPPSHRTDSSSSQAQ